MARRPTRDDAPGVHLFEHHDEAYEIWRQAGARDRVLVHIDAHHDMWWVDDVRQLSIANFVCAALKDNFVRAIYWVVPDRTWHSELERSHLARHLGKIVGSYPGNRAPVRWRRHRAETSVLGRPLVVCALDAMPALREPVLLDIDTDYCVIPRVTYGPGEAHSALPWRWPVDLVGLLQKMSMQFDVATIAYSTDGCYTPIAWKYLGAELACRVTGAAGERELMPFERMRAGAIAEDREEFAEAGRQWRAIGDALGAAPHFRLAYLLARLGRMDEGRRQRERALELDPTYGAPFVTPGMPLYVARDFAAAGRMFELSLALDGADAWAHVGLSWIAARRRRWKEAETQSRAALALEPNLIDAWRTLAETLDRQGRVPEAIDAWERSLKLGLAGQRPFNGLIATRPPEGQLLDVHHAHAHVRLARLHERNGDNDRAIAGYRIGIAAGYREPGLRTRLKRLLTRRAARKR